MPQGGWNKGKSKLVAWLKANVDHVGEECLIWPFSCNEKGYGQVGYDGRIQKAHRVMCILAHGEPPEPRYNAAHSCHNGHLGCVHPKHLSWKTPSENTQESAVFRRGDPLLRRLTIEQVDAIRASDKTHAELAAEYGIAINTVGKIMRREIWVNPVLWRKRHKRRSLIVRHILAILIIAVVVFSQSAIWYGSSSLASAHEITESRAPMVFEGIPIINRSKNINGGTSRFDLIHLSKIEFLRHVTDNLIWCTWSKGESNFGNGWLFESVLGKWESASCNECFDAHLISRGLAGIFKFESDLDGLFDSEVVNLTARGWQDVGAQLTLGGAAGVLNEIASFPDKTSGSDKQEKRYNGQRFVETGEPFSKSVGWLSLFACAVCLVIAIGYKWRGYAGVFWGAAFVMGFVAVHLLHP